MFESWSGRHFYQVLQGFRNPDFPGSVENQNLPLTCPSNFCVLVDGTGSKPNDRFSRKRTWTMHEEPPNAPALAPVDQEFLEGYP